MPLAQPLPGRGRTGSVPQGFANCSAYRHKAMGITNIRRGHGNQGRKDFKVFRLLIKGCITEEAATEINLFKSF